MAIRPIDAQIMVQRVPEAARFNTNNPSAIQAQVGQFAQEFKKELDIKEKQVNSTNEAEQRQVDKDGKGSGSKGEKQNNKGGKKEEQPQNNVVNTEGSSFSIKV